MNHNHDVLVVDDEISNLRLLTELLEKEGYQVRPAETAQLALDSAMAHPPGLILLDVRMPKMDGFEVCRRLKQHPGTQQVPIIFISSLDDADARLKGFAEGASDFIMKPFHELEVLARVKTHVRLHMMQQNMERMVEERTRELRASEIRFRSLMEQMPLALALMAPDGSFISGNEAWRQLWGFTPEEERELTKHYNIFADVEAEARGVMPLIRKAFSGNHVVVPVIEYNAKNTVNNLGLDQINPNKVWIEAHISSVMDEHDEVMFVVITYMDLTEITKAQQELQASETRFRELMEQSPLAMEILAPDGRIMRVNDAWLRFWGVTSEEAKEVLANYNMLTDKEAESLGVMPLVRKAFAGEQVVLPTVEYDANNAIRNVGLDHIESQKVWMQCHVAPVLSEEGEVQFVVNTYMDLTGVIKAQQERDRILNLSPDMISVSDMTAGLVYTNPAWQQVLGYSNEELKGKFIQDFVYPDDLVRVQTKREEVVAGDAVHDFEVRCLAKEGAVRDIALSCISVPEENLIYCVARDITERKKMEQEAREQRDALARMDRTSSMGQLTGSIAHELNQPLTGILSNAQAAEMMLGNDRWDREELLETLSDIVADTKRAGNVMRSLRDIYREQKGEFTPIEVNLLIEEALELMHGEFVMQDIHLNVQDVPSDVRVDGNRVQLQQVLVNLLLNGAQAMQDLERAERSLAVGVCCEKDGVRVWIDDTGPGIDTDKIGNIFEPLATWKPGGTGMGLAISDSIIRAHSGEMWVENRAEGGARVGFSLPVSAP